jgi:outer membrane protein OmpA-like peptidoglycan-associated protein
MRSILSRLTICGFCCLILLLVTGCGPKSLFVIMPDPDGKTGKVEVSTPKGSQILDQPWQSTEVQGIGQKPAEPRILDEKQVRAMFKDALEVRPDPPALSLVYVIMPDPDGKIGKVEVTTEKGSQILDQPWQSTEVKGIDQMPAEPKILDEAQVKEMFKEALEVKPAKPVSYIVYFDTDETRMTADSQRMMEVIIKDIKTRNPLEITLSGHTDAVGSIKYNRTLSMRRANAVAAILVAGGVNDKIIEITYHGKENPLIRTPDGVAEPRNRRVEISIR